MKQFSGLIKETTTMAVYRSLTELILSGHFEPGEWIRERQVKDILGISSTPIREALRMLVHEDILESIPHHGVRMRRLSVKEIGDFYEFRAELEGMAAELAAKRGSDKDLNHIEKVLMETKMFIQHEEESEQSAFIKLNNEFHQCIANASQNRVLVHSLDQIQTKINLLRVYSWYKEKSNRPKETLMQHQQIFEAIKDRNPQVARKKVQEHILSRLEHELEMEEVYSEK